jgi:hypothetical protein
MEFRNLFPEMQLDEKEPVVPDVSMVSAIEDTSIEEPAIEDVPSHASNGADRISSMTTNLVVPPSIPVVGSDEAVEEEEEAVGETSEHQKIADDDMDIPLVEKEEKEAEVVEQIISHQGEETSNIDDVVVPPSVFCSRQEVPLLQPIVDADIVDPTTEQAANDEQTNVVIDDDDDAFDMDWNVPAKATESVGECNEQTNKPPFDDWNQMEAKEKELTPVEEPEAISPSKRKRNKKKQASD